MYVAVYVRPLTNFKILNIELLPCKGTGTNLLGCTSAASGLTSTICFAAEYRPCTYILYHSGTVVS